MSPKIDSRLTPSIPHNSMLPSLLRVRLFIHFDTLSIYRGLLCEQVGEKMMFSCSKGQRSRFPVSAQAYQAQSSLVKPGKAKKINAASAPCRRHENSMFKVQESKVQCFQP